jgi:hypothetical protein
VSTAEWLHHVLRYAHVAIGGVGLAAFWVPVFAKKGGRTHLFFGRVFVWCVYGVAATALASAAWALIDPVSFVGAPPQSQEVADRIARRIRPVMAFLGYLAVLTLAGARLGVGLIRHRRQPERLRSVEIVGLECLSILAGAGLVVMGLLVGWPMVYVFVIFGAIGVWGGIEDLRFVLRPWPTRMAWWYKHMECMLGTGIAFHTAFAVFGGSRLFGLRIDGPFGFLPWVLPAAVGVPAIHVWIRYYQRKFGDLPEAPAGSAAAPAAVPPAESELGPALEARATEGP